MWKTVDLFMILNEAAALSDCAYKLSVGRTVPDKVAFTLPRQN